MIGTNAQTGELSLVEKARESLQRGEIALAMTYYGQVFDPDTLDEDEARSMLIEARAHLARKDLVAALENFEEALLMGTDVQRRQALDGIGSIGDIRSRLKNLTMELKKGLKKAFARKKPESVGLALAAGEENMVLISSKALETLPGFLARSSKLRQLPPRMADYALPFQTDRCIFYAEEEDIRLILEIADNLLNPAKPESSD